MSYAQGTTHYNFPQIAGTDRPTFADANEAFRTLDTKLFSLEADSTDLDTRLDTAEGNIVQLQSDVQTAQGTANQAKEKADTNAESIQILNNTTSQHTTQIANKLDSVAIADPYDPTSTYAINDIVTYNGQRWRCTTAVTVGEPFDVSKWTGEDIQFVINSMRANTLSTPDNLIGATSQATHYTAHADGYAIVNLSYQNPGETIIRINGIPMAKAVATATNGGLDSVYVRAGDTIYWEGTTPTSIMFYGYILN